MCDNDGVLKSLSDSYSKLPYIYKPASQGWPYARVQHLLMCAIHGSPDPSLNAFPVAFTGFSITCLEVGSLNSYPYDNPTARNVILGASSRVRIKYL